MDKAITALREARKYGIMQLGQISWNCRPCRHRQIGIYRGDIMLFYSFKSQDERSKFGGSAFIEVQFCMLPADSRIEGLVAVGNIEHWNNDSLYIADEHLFYQEYGSFFDSGTYNNLKTGTMDLYGINYYAPASIDTLIKRMDENKPLEYETLRAWLIKAKDYNGFYILGM